MARRIVTEFDARTGRFERGVDRIDQRLGRFQGEVDRRLERFDRRFEMSARAVGRLGAAVGVLGAGATIGAIGRYTEEWRNAERQLTSIGETSDRSKQKLVDLAVRTRAGLNDTGAAVQRFAKSTGGDLDTTIRRVETLNKLFASGGLSGAERGSVTLQLGQALQSGVLGGEELRALREAAPVELLDAIAVAAGATRGELKELGSQGKLTSDLVLRAIDSMATQADRDFAKLAISGDEAFAVLRTGLSSFIGRVDESLGATETFNQAIAGMGEYLAESGESAETFARALELVGIAAVATAGGKCNDLQSSGFRPAFIG